MAYSRRKLSTKPRRRTQVKALFPRAAAAADLITKGIQIYDTAKQMKKEYSGMRGGNRKPSQKTSNRKGRAYKSNLFAADNITTVPPVIIGIQKPISFQEKCSRAVNPPLLFKRNYQFSAESLSGRKGFFSMEINTMGSNDIQTDITGYKAQMRSDTTVADTQLSGNAIFDGAKFYIDRHHEKIRIINSSTNSIFGRATLVAHKRDNDGIYQGSSTPITPINMMMYYSTNSIPQLSNGLGGEQTLGNGWLFSGAAGVTNYTAVYNMPGSSLNAAGNTASTDTQLSLFSPHIADRMGFWFRKVNSSTFSLKPGQQFNSSYIFNDLPKIYREQQDYLHLAGISYSLVIEFNGQIVGDGTVTTGDGVVSFGSSQLSVIRESTRTLGLQNTLKSKIVLQTAPPATILNAAQVTINADSGVMDTGVEQDT